MIFTPLETQILELVAEGKTNAAIGRRTHRATETIRATLRRMCRNTGAPNRAALVTYGFEHDILHKKEHVS